MKKFIRGVTALCIILLCAAANSVCAEDNTVRVELNGEILSFDVQPMIVSGRTMVPMRKIFESLGAEVLWEGSTRTVTAKTADTVVIMQIDNPVITVNEKKIELDVPPMIVNDRTLVPVRAASEGLGALVDWDGTTNTVIITKEKPVVNETDIFDDFEKRLRNSTLLRMGDSYYNWSIDIPQGLPLTTLTGDGRYFEFSTEGMTNIVSLHIVDAADTTIGDLQKSEQDYVRNANARLLSQTIEKTEEGTEYVRTVYEYTHYYSSFHGDSRMFLKDGYIYSLYTRCFADDNEEIEYYKKIADSFDFTYNSAETEPLQKIENGCRWYSDTKYKVGFYVPAGWIVRDLNNQIVFLSGDLKDPESVGMIGLSIFSVTEGETLEQYAQKSKRAYEELYTKGDHVYTQSEITKITVGGNAGVHYTDEVNDPDLAVYRDDIFLYIGDYVYNLSFSFKNADSSVIDTVRDSFIASELDKNEVGYLIPYPAG